MYLLQETSNSKQSTVLSSDLKRELWEFPNIQPEFTNSGDSLGPATGWGGADRTEPLTRGLFANSRQLASELNQVVGPPIGVSRDLENCLVGTSPNFCCQKWCKCKLLSSVSPLTYALGNLHKKLARMEIFFSWENVRGESKRCPPSNNWTTQRERPPRCKFPD